MSGRLARIANRVKYEGPFRLGRLAIYRVLRKVFRLTIVSVYAGATNELAERRKTLERSPTDFAFRWLTADEVRTLGPCADELLPLYLADRIDADVSECFAALDGEKLAGFVWFAKRGFPPEWIYGPHVEIPNDHRYLFNAVTLEEYRGQKLFARTVAEAAAQLQSAGIERLFLTVECDNTASHRAVSRAGFAALGAHVTIGMPFGKIIKRSALDLLDAKPPQQILGENEAPSRHSDATG